MRATSRRSARRDSSCMVGLSDSFTYLSLTRPSFTNMCMDRCSLEMLVLLICQYDPVLPGDPGFQMKSGNKYGSGIYFSEYPDYSMRYIRGSTKLLLCKVLLGKVTRLPTAVDNHCLTGLNKAKCGMS